MQTPTTLLDALARLVTPRVITGSWLDRLMHRALRNGGWTLLTPFERAWLRASRFIRVIKSPVARKIAERIAAKVELATTRGKALLLGILHAIEKGLEHLLADYQALLITGLNILNRPPLHEPGPTITETLHVLLYELAVSPVTV